ncbi:MAG: hypothetical protein LBV27_06925, partial [Oscillospiraceae bacterium]|nr:hypothetical protein [Oscillospiraceae bacterium]
MGLFDMMFTTRIPESLRFRSFSRPHVVLLLLVACGSMAAACIASKKDEGKRRRLLLIGTWALPCIYVIRFT